VFELIKNIVGAQYVIGLIHVGTRQHLKYIWLTPELNF
jgi:hypothetical protein